MGWIFENEVSVVDREDASFARPVVWCSFSICSQSNVIFFWGNQIVIVAHLVIQWATRENVFLLLTDQHHHSNQRHWQPLYFSLRTDDWNLLETISPLKRTFYICNCSKSILTYRKNNAIILFVRFGWIIYNNDI